MRIAARALGILALSLAPGRSPIHASAAAAGIEIRETDERAWMAEVGARIAARHGVAADDLQFSPDRRRIAFVKTALPTTSRRGPRTPVHRLIVVSVEGKLQAVFRPITARARREPPKGLDFLGNDRLVYELETTPPEPASAPAFAVRTRRAGPVAQKARAATAPATLAPSKRLFVIQPLKRRARPVRCEGSGFTFTTRRHRLAYVAGAPDVGSVFVDGRRVYPRRGSTAITSDPAWSPDGLALAFLEAPADGPPRLVLIAHVENASGDTVWDLAPSLDTQGLRVFWAGADRMLVGKTMSAPVFSASFEVERPVTR